jgi:predicted ArsR family transcriptional regulator
MSADDFDHRVAGVAALGEPVRRAIYRYVVAQPGPVSREQVAVGVNVAHHVAKFHLDRLERDGLLEVESARPPGRRPGPGAGRPAKLYRRSSRELGVSLPERRYDLAGHLMARAITDAERDNVPVTQTLQRAARDAGRSLGAHACQLAGREPGPAATLATLHQVLSQSGFEPRAAGPDVVLTNCPFHKLARTYPDLVCAMNLDMINGVLDELGDLDLEAGLDPAPDRCCVLLRHR